jgi:hypothetical protein
MRRLNPGWFCLLPEVTAPMGGGLMKIGHASTWAAASVGLAPYVVLGALYAIFVIGYIPAVFCYLCSGHDRQDAIHRLITTSANAIVSLLTLTPADSVFSNAPRGDKPGLKVLNGGSGDTSA